MAYSYEWKEWGLHFRFTGRVTGREIHQGTRGLHGDARFDDLVCVVVDFSEAESFDVTEQEIKEIAYIDRAAAKSNPNLRMAIVAHQKIIKELSNFYAKHGESSPWEIRVFDTPQEAKKWLGLPE